MKSLPEMMYLDPWFDERSNRKPMEEESLNNSGMRCHPILYGHLFLSICDWASILVESLPEPLIKLRG